MDRAVRQRIRIHDRYQLEIKLTYPLASGKRTQYQVSTYLFIPHNLAISELTYSSNEFYRRLQNYIRFKTPELSIDALLCDSVSPLNRLDQLWQRPITEGDETQINRVVEQLKLLRAILRLTLNQTLRQRWRKLFADPAVERTDASGNPPLHNLTRDERAAVLTPQSIEAAAKLMTTHVALVQQILERFRAHATKAADEQTPARLRYSYRLTDEALSVVVEGNLVNALRMAQSLSDPALHARIKPLLIPSIHAELEYRREQGYHSILAPWQYQPAADYAADQNQEYYLHHLSLLKKYTSSVLYLATSLHSEGETLEHLLFALAAGISMIFATVIAFYVQAVYGNFTSPLFVALVVGYMFKDRIKETGRSISKTLLRRYYYDRRVYIYTLDRKQRLGRVREKMVFLAPEDVPQQVQVAHQQSRLSPIQIEGYDEHVIRYSRNVRLIANAFREVRDEGIPITGLSDILRLDIRPFLHKMDNPTERRYSLAGDDLRKLKLDRVYYVNIISTYRQEGNDKLTLAKNVRITLNRKGLVRLEEL